MRTTIERDGSGRWFAQVIGRDVGGGVQTRLTLADPLAKMTPELAEEMCRTAVAQHRHDFGYNRAAS